ncbi:cobalamin biosynthesis protein [Anaerovorax odorimutans]|uniref:Cobalamin biosynthesis protein n=1 Tax=Anaerovorax odorimutans TaxID=109327 RepID=A0ABT1RMJ1_9FIRM|nr:cobalamin biosynthesis protein [Anaerovorax odorimutans]MCQ4636390.1 cobalamin biosynthesis protein [Anaerovorax odorimutans]
MKISLIAFTKKGAGTCLRIAENCAGAGVECRAFQKGSFPPEKGLSPVKETLSQWTKEAFQTEDALVFVGAAAIAVRAIAPFLKSKTVDPAVVSVDEQGRYVIPLASGHIGGANRLARQIAGQLGATPVITTATDINDVFAVDQWAKENDLMIGDMKLAKQISADLLQGKKIGLVTAFSIVGNLPQGLTYGKAPINIEISAARKPLRDNTLRLIPKSVVLGIGCRRGISRERIEALAEQVLEQENICWESVCQVASIDLKKDEPGLTNFCERRGLPLNVYTAEELAALSGDFSGSGFVRTVTGVDNVCERAAMLACGRGNLAVRKQARDGVTLAVAVKARTYTF